MKLTQFGYERERERKMKFDEFVEDCWNRNESMIKMKSKEQQSLFFFLHQGWLFRDTVCLKRVRESKRERDCIQIDQSQSIDVCLCKVRVR